jgi:hypothetical protein
MSEYNVVLKDKDGYNIATDPVSGLAAAKARAKFLRTDTYAQNLGTTHSELGTHKVEVQTTRPGTCLWDAFRRER